MRILLTNDDGINAPGFAVLERIAATLSDDIWVCAPNDEQSGAGHSLTLSRPVRLRKLGEKRHAVLGTPTDSVMLSLAEVFKDRRPDLILSGVNRGANLGDDVTYSGTVSAAMEGCLAGIKSIALSQVYSKEGAGNDVRFDAAEAWGERVLRPLLDIEFPERTLVNVNFPPRAAEEVKGIRVVRQGFHDYSRVAVVKQVDPRGFPYFWFGLHSAQQTVGHDTDLEVVADGYISVTPLKVDLTDFAALGQLASAYGLGE